MQLFVALPGARPGRDQAFELMSGLGTAFVLRHIPGAVLPLAAPAPYYVLVELATPRPDAGLRAALEAVLEEALGDGVIADAAIAESEAQRAAIWRLREEHSEAQKREGASVKNDVSVPVSKVPEFIRRATAACEALMPGIRAVPFGHMGDGNIHFNLEQPEGADPAWFLAQDHAIMDTVNEVVRAFDGSFSAEHGIGRLKPYMMPDWRGGAELDADAADQGGTRSRGDHESGEGTCPVPGLLLPAAPPASCDRTAKAAVTQAWLNRIGTAVPPHDIHAEFVDFGRTRFPTGAASHCSTAWSHWPTSSTATAIFAPGRKPAITFSTARASTAAAPSPPPRARMARFEPAAPTLAQAAIDALDMARERTR